MTVIGGSLPSSMPNHITSVLQFDAVAPTSAGAFLIRGWACQWICEIARRLCRGRLTDCTKSRRLPGVFITGPLVLHGFVIKGQSYVAKQLKEICPTVELSIDEDESTQPVAQWLGEAVV